MRLYQINRKKDKERVRFLGLQELQDEGLNVDPKIYDLVFEGEVATDDLETLWSLFNSGIRPGAKKFCSMSVSDVVVRTDGDSVAAYFCDSIGFKEICFDESMTGIHSGFEKPIRVVLAAPGERAVETFVDPSHEGICAAIGCRCFDEIGIGINGVYLRCDGEGKHKGKPLNRGLYVPGTNVCEDIICGRMILCAIKDGNWEDLTDEQVAQCMERFKLPERFTQEDPDGPITGEQYHTVA